MTAIEQKGQALLAEIRDEASKLIEFNASTYQHLTRWADCVEAHARAIEQHEAFRREVSDTVDAAKRTYGGHRQAFDQLERFIIAKPVDPFLIEAREVCARVEEERNNPVWATRYRSGQYDELGWVKHIRAALAARGLEIREKQP